MSKRGDMTLPLERYITNFCSEIPAPPPGAFEVQTTVLDSVIRMWSLPHNLPIIWVSVPFGSLFECLDIDHIITVWHCLMLERQVLFTSTQLSMLTTASEIFLSLLFPMRWSHAYIPVLPHFLIPILSAPMPFLCGIHKANLADALFDLSPDCVLVDLDKNTVTLGPDTTPLPPLPSVQEERLWNELDANVGMVFREARSLRKTDDYSDNGIHLPAHTKMMAEAMWESKLALQDEAFHLQFTPEEARKNRLNGNDGSGMEDPSNSIVMLKDKQQSKKQQSEWDAVQEAFLDTSVYLLRNYRKYLVFPSKHNEGSYGGAGFRSQDFIEGQRYDMRDFLEQMIGTQMFDNFITKRLYGSGESDVAFFDMAVDRFLKKNGGLFADVDLSGRFVGSSGNKARSSTSTGRAKRTTVVTKKEGDCLLQSARIHRKLKTIVPPEPTGEGLIVKGSEAATDGTAPNGSTHAAESSENRNALQRVQDNAAEIVRRNELSKYKYDYFPTELNKDLFGDPRPLPPAVMAEFDRQRNDAAQFVRKGESQEAGGNTSNQLHRAAMDSEPPSPEVATFTVFFMAFTAQVGKELVDMAKRVDDQQQQRTILSTYLPTVGSEDDATTDSESDTASAQSSVVDEEEKQDVADMKTSRPAMMFDDEDEAGVPAQPPATAFKAKKSEKKEKPASPARNKGPSSTADSDNDSTKQGSVKSTGTTESVRKNRFRQKIADSEIEEAKAAGRGQLGLAFEMLTMMKRRGLRADPEAYQCMIDACGRVGDTKRATELLGKMHEDGIVADGTVYACLVAAFSVESAWKDNAKDDDLPEWANSTAVEMDWNKFQKKSLLSTLVSSVVDLEDSDGEDGEEQSTTYQKLRKKILTLRQESAKNKAEEGGGMEFFVTEPVERQIQLGENLLEIVCPDISIDTEEEVCSRCQYELSDDDVVVGWTPGDSNDYTTSCPNCRQRFVPHFKVQCSSATFVGSRGPSSPLVCERLSPWVLQKEVRSVMSDEKGTENIASPVWREQEYKNAVLWWNLVLSCMRYRFPFTFLLQGSFDQSLITPMPEDEV